MPKKVSHQKKHVNRKKYYVSTWEKISVSDKKKILEMNEAFSNYLDISKFTGISTRTIKLFLNDYYKGGGDPFKKYIAGLIKSGMTQRQIEISERVERRFVKEIASNKMYFDIYYNAKKKIIRERKKLKTVGAISRNLDGWSSQRIAVFIKERFGDSDPLKLEAIRLANNGMSGAEICRVLHMASSTLRRLLENTGISFEATHKEKLETQKSKKKARIKKEKERKDSLIDDVFCLWKSCGTVKQTALESGYTTQTNHILLSHPEYKKISEDRLKLSKNRGMQYQSLSASAKYKKEKDFHADCLKVLCDMNIVHGFDPKNTHTKNSYSNPDIIIRKNLIDYIIIELKISFRKKNQFTAMGQLLSSCVDDHGNRSEYDGAKKVVCIPDDIVYDPGISEVFKAVGITLCYYCDLKTTVENM